MLAVSAHSYAASTVANPINEDLFFSNGVQIEDVTETAQGVASVTLQGSGSLTVGSQASGGFPRVAVSAGTTITSNRYWPAETVPKTSWDGQFTAPGSGRLPSSDEITFQYAANLGNNYQAVGAFVWGLSNEVFSFSVPARFMLPVDEADGQRLWVAPASGSGWAVTDANNYCVVESGLCYLELTSFGGLALVKQTYADCPKSTVNNGTVGSAPNCIVTCNSGYYIDNEGNECLSDNFDSSAPVGGGDVSDGDESVESQWTEEDLKAFDDFSEPEQETIYDFASEYGYDPLELIRATPGGVRERGSAASIRYYLEEYTDMTDEELAKVRHINTGYMARNPRSAEEQIAAYSRDKDPAEKRAEDDSFASYLLAMRNRFASQQGGEAVVAGQTDAVAQGALADAEGAASGAASDQFHSAGGLLPSTGPGLFIAIAIIGFMLMLFGGIRRN